MTTPCVIDVHSSKLTHFNYANVNGYNVVINILVYGATVKYLLKMCDIYTAVCPISHGMGKVVMSYKITIYERNLPK